MKWTVLSDNRSCDTTFETEHGLSILLETEKHRILLDTGASDVFIRNAKQMGIDLSTVDYVFISHGHSDHAGGLKHLMNINDNAKVIVSPDAMSGRFYSKRGNLHSITAEWPKIGDGRLVLIDQTCAIAEDIHVIAHIPQTYPMPKGNVNLYVQNTNDDLIHDDFRHELALYVDGLLFTGCAHSGLENILAACPWPVHTVVGGFHLLDDYELTEQREPSSSHALDLWSLATAGTQEWPSRDGSRRSQTEEELAALAQRLKAKYPNTQFFTSHCTGDKVFATLKTIMGNQLHAFSCGMTIN
jgi:7,8-dihydropterin-6-yl-methyl-4-(beta-D-ribofuranosyl)aminobenzene 5'-phosphate synthase